MTLSKLLIADDEPSVLRLLEVGLQSDDVVIRTATSGREALAVAAEWKPDVLLVDVLLPDVDGFAVCRRIREHSTVPIILMSELRHDQNLALCLDAGADDYVAKPFSVAALAVRIAAVLRRADLPLDGGTPREIACDRGRLTIDLERGVALRRGHVVPLGNTQYRLLAYLADNAGPDCALRRDRGAGLGTGPRRRRRRRAQTRRHPASKTRRQPGASAAHRRGRGRRPAVHAAVREHQRSEDVANRVHDISHRHLPDQDARKQLRDLGNRR